ncbi:MAG TPA: hypothetical protein VIE65_07535 [Methylobacter sp.]|jgi:hypothetical protein
MGRLLPAGALVRDQIDLYSPAGSANRVPGYGISGLSLTLFLNNVPLSWPLADGSSVPDSSISSGTVYYNEIQSVPGFYAIRFFPNAVGFWRVVLTATPLLQVQIREYDIVPAGFFGQSQGGGLTASFDK